MFSCVQRLLGWNTTSENAPVDRYACLPSGCCAVVVQVASCCCVLGHPVRPHKSLSRMILGKIMVVVNGSGQLLMVLQLQRPVRLLWRCWMMRWMTCHRNQYDHVPLVCCIRVYVVYCSCVKDSSRQGWSSSACACVCARIRCEALPQAWRRRHEPARAISHN
jgi:hypothetical protein